MHIIEQRFLRGANLYSGGPCLLTLLDLGRWRTASPADVAGLRAGLPPAFRDPPEPGAHVADVVARLAMALQRLAGNPVAFSMVNEARADSGQYRIVCAYVCERVAAAALAGAIALVEASATDAGYDVDALLEELRRLARRDAIDGSTAALLTAAQRRGIPGMRVDRKTGLFQLGWGGKRQLLHAAAAADVHLADSAIEAMFGQDDGRIPLIAVTGTNGKTTTTRLIAHAAGLTGLTTGMTTTEGVYIDGARIKAGDCTGYHSARTLLAAPEVRLAVLETARGGILKRGLAFDRCDVGVVLNVTADHLGMDGVETLEDLARVKQVVADAAGKVVLNADDPVCVAMRSRLRAGVEVLYFSLDADNPVLSRHLRGGGRAVFLRDHMMILADGERESALIDARKAPVTLNGLARHNIANALAAAAALAAAGFDVRDIVGGLSSFVSDGRNNPLRSNVFDVEGIRVVMDFAHNAAAYAALAEMARGLSGGRLVGVVSVPGDRRDCDLRQVGEVCAAGFDDLVIYESENRGRPEGEVARLLALGARGGGADVARLFCKIEVHHAIRFGLKLCRPGDVLAFGCGSSIDELLEAIRRERPAVAERIHAEVAQPPPGLSARVAARRQTEEHLAPRQTRHGTLTHGADKKYSLQ